MTESSVKNRLVTDFKWSRAESLGHLQNVANKHIYCSNRLGIGEIVVLVKKFFLPVSGQQNIYISDLSAYKGVMADNNNYFFVHPGDM